MDCKDGSLRWCKFKIKNDYKIVNVNIKNIKKYNTLYSDLAITGIKYEILKNKDREGALLVENDVIIGFYHLLLKPILELVYITISKKYRGQKLCNLLIEHLTNYIIKKNINILKIVNAGDISALKCYLYLRKIKYNI